MQFTEIASRFFMQSLYNETQGTDYYWENFHQKKRLNIFDLITAEILLNMALYKKAISISIY